MQVDKVDQAASEDMDTLTFESPVLMRHLTFSEARKMPIVQVELSKVLEGLEMTRDQVYKFHASLLTCVFYLDVIIVIL
jgi:flap endonuclease-1